MTFRKQVYSYQFVGSAMTDILSIKDVTKLVTLGISMGMKNLQSLFLLLLALTFSTEIKI